MLIFRGLTGNLLLGQFVGPFPKGFQNIASGFLPDFTDIGGLAHGAARMGANPLGVAPARRRRRAGDVRVELPALAALQARRDGGRAPAAADRQEPRVRGDHRRHRLEPRAVQGPAGHPGHHGGADAVLRVRHHAHRGRAAHLCARRQRAGGAALRREDRAARLPHLRQYGPARGLGRPRRRRAPQFVDPERRQRIRARRHRRLLHRRRVGLAAASAR